VVAEDTDTVFSAATAEIAKVPEEADVHQQLLQRRLGPLRQHR
jgi:hypothetical protein